MATESIRSYRLGKQSRGKDRPLKVIFKSSNNAKMFTSMFSQELVSAANDDYAGLAISRDRTPEERQHLQGLRKELEDQKKKGETSLTIKYIHRVLTIEVPAKNE